MDIKELLLLWFINFLIKSPEVVALIMKQNEQLTEELHKPIIKKKKKMKYIHKDNIWGVGLADMELISKFNKGIRVLLCVIDFFY